MVLSFQRDTRSIIEDESNAVFISMTSFYKMAIKMKLDKLVLGKSLRAYLNDAKAHNFSILPISESHIITYELVPLVDTHRDPFDRLIIATALSENLVILTAG